MGGWSRDGLQFQLVDRVGLTGPGSGSGSGEDVQAEVAASFGPLSLCVNGLVVRRFVRAVPILECGVVLARVKAKPLRGVLRTALTLAAGAAVGRLSERRPIWSPRDRAQSDVWGSVSRWSSRSVR